MDEYGQLMDSPPWPHTLHYWKPQGTFVWSNQIKWDFSTQSSGIPSHQCTTAVASDCRMESLLKSGCSSVPLFGQDKAVLTSLTSLPSRWICLKVQLSCIFFSVLYHTSSSTPVHQNQDWFKSQPPHKPRTLSHSSLKTLSKWFPELHF